MERLIVNLRHGTAEPIQTEINGSLLARIRGLQCTQAIHQILQALPEEKRPYGQAMLSTMQGADAVVEVVNIMDEEVVAIDRRREESFGSVLGKLSRLQDGNRPAIDEIEIGAARLEKGGAAPVAASSVALGGKSEMAFPPPHHFFTAAEQSLLVVKDGRVYRPRPAPLAAKPYFLFCGERFALTEDQRLSEYDEAYHEDYSEEFNRAFWMRALGKAEDRLRRGSNRFGGAPRDLAEFVATRLMQRLESFRIGRETFAQFQTIRLKQTTELCLQQDSTWRPQPYPLCETLPADCLVLAPHVYPLEPCGSFSWRSRPDPGVYFTGATYGTCTAQPLSQIEKAYVRLHEERLEQETGRRMPRYTNLLLQWQKQDEQVAICSKLLDRSRRESAEIIFYNDSFHVISALKGVFVLHRNVPAFILHTGDTFYLCAATRLSIVLPAPIGEQIFFRGSVRTGQGFHHPLVERSNVVLMDRCDNDFDNLRYSMDLCGALIKHLNDAKLMLEIGFDQAPPPSIALRPISRSEAERLGLPFYRFRHSSHS